MSDRRTFCTTAVFLTIKKSRRTKHERNKSISRKNIKGEGIIEEKKNNRNISRKDKDTGIKRKKE